MPTVGQIVTSDTWLDAFALAGLLIGSPLEIENIGTEEIRFTYNVASPTLADKVNSKVLYEGQKIVLPFGLSYVWIIGAERDSRVNISKPSTQNNIFQNYQEANTKIGNAFKFSGRKTGVTSGATLALANNLYLGISTGQFPLTIKSRFISATGSTEVVYNAYEDSVYTGGSPVFVGNQGRLSVRAPFFTVVQDPTITSIGNQYLPNFSVLTAVAASSRLGTDSLGDETNLKPNTKHLFRANNIGSGTADVIFLQILCYEGSLDFPL